jgi:hypothetical protein
MFPTALWYGIQKMPKDLQNRVIERWIFYHSGLMPD